jgi:hypothetical protein
MLGLTIQGSNFRIHASSFQDGRCLLRQQNKEVSQWHREAEVWVVAAELVAVAWVEGWAVDAAWAQGAIVSAPTVEKRCRTTEGFLALK